MPLPQIPFAGQRNTVHVLATMAQRKTLLIVDDDADLRGAVAEQLQAEDFATLEAATAGEGVRLAQTERPDLILLDVDLPDFDGREACRRMRASGVATPVIMLTAAAEDDDTVQGLDAGANDYVTKPYKFAVLLARIRVQLRDYEHSEGAVFRLGAYEFRPAAKMLIDPQAQEDPPDGEGNQHPEVPLPRRRKAGVARGAAGRGLGLQRRRHHPHAGNPRLPPAPEDRERPGQRQAAADRGRRYRLAP